MDVSIIIPIYNAEKYLRRCLDSIVSQSFKDYEVLLIDDGSTDNSGKICNEYTYKYKNFKVFHKENEGSASARNYGLVRAEGNYIIFVDADDFVHEEYVDYLYKAIIKTGADIVQCQYKIVDDKSVIDYSLVHEIPQKYSNIEFLELFCEKKNYVDIVVLWNKIYKKSLFDNLYFPVGKGIDDDYLICQIVYRAKQIIIISECLYYYYMSSNSQMRSKPSLKKIDNIDAIRSQLEFLETIHERRLYDKLLYRYYAAILDDFYFLKKYFPNEKMIIDEINKERKQILSNLIVNKEITIANKLIIFFRYFFPKMFELLQKKKKK